MVSGKHAQVLLQWLPVLDLTRQQNVRSSCRHGHAIPPHAWLVPLMQAAMLCSEDALDLLSRLLVFNPARRLSAAEALAHPYVAQFHAPADEPIADSVITIPINDNTKARARCIVLGVDTWVGSPLRLEYHAPTEILVAGGRCCIAL